MEGEANMPEFKIVTETKCSSHESLFIRAIRGIRGSFLPFVVRAISPLILLAFCAPALAAEKTAEKANRFSDEDYAKHIEALKKKLPSDNFTVIIEKPFVVIGDEDARTVQSRSISTVRWAVKRLKEKYFDKDPNAIL